MEILHVNDVANVASNLVAGLNKLNEKVELLEIKPLLPKASYIIKFLITPLRIFQFFLVNRKIKKKNYHIVHIHYAYYGWLGILGRYRYFLHCHGSDIRYHLFHPIKRFLILPAIKKALRVFYSTPDLWDILKQVRPDAVFLPNPINTEKFANTFNNKSNNILLFAALSDKKKGTNKAIEALNDLVKMPEFKDVKITAFPHGTDYDKYKDCKFINFTTLKINEEIPDFLCLFNIVMGQFAFGSIGMSELEAMACGKPVITNFIFDDFYPEPPPLISCKNSEEITDKLILLLKDKNYQKKLGEQARGWTIKHHNYKAVASKLRDEYLKCSVN